MAVTYYKRFIILGFVTIVLLFLLNTFILYSYQENALNEKGIEKQGYNGLPRVKNTDTGEKVAKATGTFKGFCSHKDKVKIGQETAGKDKFSFSNGRKKRQNIHFQIPEKSLNHKQDLKQVEWKEKAFVKFDSKVMSGGIERDRVTTVLDQSQEWKIHGSYDTEPFVTTKTPLTKKKKRQETKKEKERREKDGYGKHAFNQSASDIFPLNRSVPDTRGPGCKHKHHPSNLPITSVIICFHNEALSTLLRTVHSVFNRSPSNLLAEVILVDDFSDDENLTNVLQEVVPQLNKVRLLRMPKREGLIRSRLQGAKAAKGDVITFLDSHCEVNIDWLEPLLMRIYGDRTTVTIPAIDVIDYDTFEYKKQIYTTIGGFRWENMNFYWHHVNLTQDPDEPRRSPVMPGGIFAIERKFFFEVGSYDEMMNVWGGENLEMSFRVWQCGGKMEIVPCSRVGHVYRKRIPYTFPGGTSVVFRNIARVVHVWMDEYKKYAYIYQPYLKYISFGDISSRLQLRNSLKCKDFQWYLETVYPEQTLPTRDFENFGEVRNLYSGLCLEISAQSVVGSAIQLSPCHGQVINQWFYLSKKGGLTPGPHATVCVESTKNNIGLIACKRHTGYPGPWSIKGKTLYHTIHKECLEVSQEDQRLGLNQCNNSPAQEWIIIS